jgi:hypothetical protein
MCEPCQDDVFSSAAANDWQNVHIHR